MSKLLSINNYFYRRDGSEAIYLDHNREFERVGWEVVPFSMEHPNNPDSPWSKYFVKEIEFGHEYSVLEKIRRVPKIIYSFESRRKLAALLEKVQPDIAHCHSIYHHLSPSILGVLRGAGVPTVMTLHDLKIACPSYHMFEDTAVCERCKGGRLYNVVVKRCVKGSLLFSSIVMLEAALHAALRSYEANIDRFISPCRFYIDKLVEWGWRRERFLHIPNFVDTGSMVPEFEPGTHILYFGRLSAEKGLPTLIAAAAAAKVSIRIAGDGPQRDALVAQVEASGADVTFLGRLSGAVLEDEIRAARATVLPAEWYENAPMSILESYALGKPVIGAAIGGIPELIEVGQSGWTYTSKSVEELASLLRLVTDLPDHAVRQMGRQARALAEREYSLPTYRDRVLDLYAQLGARA